MKWGVVMSSPNDLRVLEKMVCFNERNAIKRGRDWKRRNPANVVRTFSLMPGDSSPGKLVRLVYCRQRKP